MPDSTFLRRAIELSELAYKSGKGLPIGCVIARDGAIVGEGHNEIFARCNPTAHAEMVAIEDACARTRALDLAGCELYTTLEPCPMCLAAIYWAKVCAVYFANSSHDARAVGFDDPFILRELTSPPEQRRIPTIGLPTEGAARVLREWKASGRAAAQPWAGERSSASCGTGSP
jgi:tRNA(Arg) A34 adenosine deaminase TadA